MSNVQAGWYPDPWSPGQQRWWDGAQWSASTHGGPAGYATPGYATPAGAPPGYGPAGNGPAGYGPAGYGPAGYATPGYAPVVPLVAPYPLASWGVRAGARIVDAIIVQAVTVPLFFLAFVPFLGAMGVAVGSVPEGSDPDPNLVAGAFFSFFALILVVALVATVLQIAYEVVLTARWGMTLGKRVVGIRVRAIDVDRLPTWQESFFRAGVIFVGALVGSGVFSLIDYLWPLWDKPFQQTLHDKVAKTTVVPR